MTTADAKALTPAFLAMTPRQKWETLVLNGLIGTDEPWIEDMRQALREQEAALEAPHSLTEAMIEALGESLFALSDKLAASGILSASDAVHAAYERVVADYTVLQAARPIDQQEAKRADVLGEVVDTVLRYVSATGKNELTLDDERARSGIADLLRERLDQFLSTPIAPVQDDYCGIVVT